MTGVAQKKPLPPPLSALLHKATTADHETSISQTMTEFHWAAVPDHHLLSVTTKPAPELSELLSHTTWQGWEKHFASFYCSEAFEALIFLHAGTVTYPFSLQSQLILGHSSRHQTLLFSPRNLALIELPYHRRKLKPHSVETFQKAQMLHGSQPSFLGSGPHLSGSPISRVGHNNFGIDDCPLRFRDKFTSS